MNYLDQEIWHNHSILIDNPFYFLVITNSIIRPFRI